MAAFILLALLISSVYGMNIGVEVLGGSSVRVEWRVVEGVDQYNVKLSHPDGSTVQSVLVDCQRKDGVCAVAFNEMPDGRYKAEVSYSGERTTEDTTTTTYSSDTFNLQQTKQECRLPFLNIAGRCFMMETVNLGSWYDMKQHCLQFGGQLANLDDANILYYIIKYIYDQSLSAHDFWIGASDEGSEGNFKWLDGTDVKMNSPYWGYSNSPYWGYSNNSPYSPYWGYSNNDGHEPNGGSVENCLSLSVFVYFDFNDATCGENYAGVCEQVD